MDMDVYGKSPASEQGKYFRNNVWFWRPLATYCCEIAPGITSACMFWQSNDGDGLDADGSVALADALQAEIDSGRCDAYEKIYAAELAALPRERCWICDATGIRRPVPHIGAGDPARGGIKCNGCDGTGWHDSSDKHYPFSVENVKEFVAFLRECGGFEIC